MSISDHLTLEQAFRMKSAHEVARVLRQYSTDTYAAREAVMEAVRRQDPAWQIEFWNQIGESEKGYLGEVRNSR